MIFTKVEKQGYLNSMKKSFKKYRNIEVTTEGTKLYSADLVEELTKLFDYSNNYIMDLVNGEIIEIIRHFMNSGICSFIDSKMDGGYEAFHTIMSSSDDKTKTETLDKLRSIISENKEAIFTGIEEEILNTTDKLLNELIQINNIKGGGITDVQSNILN